MIACACELVLAACTVLQRCWLLGCEIKQTPSLKLEQSSAAAMIHPNYAEMTPEIESCVHTLLR